MSRPDVHGNPGSISAFSVYDLEELFVGCTDGFRGVAGSASRSSSPRSPPPSRAAYARGHVLCVSRSAVRPVCASRRNVRTRSKRRSVAWCHTHSPMSSSDGPELVRRTLICIRSSIALIGPCASQSEASRVGPRTQRHSAQSSPFALRALTRRLCLPRRLLLPLRISRRPGARAERRPVAALSSRRTRTIWMAPTRSPTRTATTRTRRPASTRPSSRPCPPRSLLSPSVAASVVSLTTRPSPPSTTGRRPSIGTRATARSDTASASRSTAALPQDTASLARPALPRPHATTAIRPVPLRSLRTPSAVRRSSHGFRASLRSCPR